MRARFVQFTESRQNNLDFLRFVLACVVIHTHSFAIAGRESRSWFHRLSHGQLGGAWIAVDMFFVLSGFLVCKSWFQSRGLWDYLRRRALRIYPAFVVALLFCVLVVGPLGGIKGLADYFGDFRTYRFFLPLALGPVNELPGVFQAAPWAGLVNGSIWTIRFELICYLLLAIAGRSGLLARRGATLALFFVALALLAAQVHEWPMQWDAVLPFFGDVWELPRFVTFFLGGVNFYLYRDRIPRTAGAAGLCVAVLAAVAPLRMMELALPIFGAYLLFYAAFQSRPRLHKFGRYGDFSYGLYLYAFPVQQLLVRFIPAARNPLLLTALGFVVALCLAVASWYGVERPFIGLKKRARTGLAGGAVRSVRHGAAEGAIGPNQLPAVAGEGM